MAYYDKDELKDSLDQDDVFKFLEEFGAEPEPTSFGLVAKTICHNGEGDGSHKLYYYNNTKLFNCYTACGYMDIFQLLGHIKKEDELTFYETMDFVARFFGLSGVSRPSNYFQSVVEDDLQILRGYKALERNNDRIEVQYDIYKDDLINNLSFVAPSSWIEEGIGIEAMKKYKIRYYGTDHKIVIPHYNINHDLIGVRGRAMNKEDEVNFGKYMPLKVGGTMYTHPLSQNLYGLEHNLNNIKSMKKIIIFEGEKSVLHYETMFGKGNNIAVATCGNSLSLIQQEIIEKFCNVDEVVIAYDKDFEESGDLNFKKSVANLQRIANRMNNRVKVSVLFDKWNLLDYKDAPIDKGKEVFKELYTNRIFI